MLAMPHRWLKLAPKLLVCLFALGVIADVEGCPCDVAPIYEHDNSVANNYIIVIKNESVVADNSGVEWRASTEAHLGNSLLVSLTDRELADARSVCATAYVESDALGDYEDDETSTPANMERGELVVRAIQDDASW